MISKQYFESTFSLATAQALQTWADDNLIVQSIGDYGMKISYVSAGEMFAETQITGLQIGVETTLRLNCVEQVSNAFRIFINLNANDNTSAIAELGWGLGQRTLIFTPTATTMYLAVGDNTGCDVCLSVIDNVSFSIGSIENGTFEDGLTTGWYGQNGNAVVSSYPYASEPLPPGDNDYLEPVELPIYDAGNPTHVRIPTDAPMADSTFNNASYQHFFIEPANYGTQLITITASGSSVNRKTVQLYNGNDTHPAELGKDYNEVANYMLSMQGASYWTFDRYCVFDNGDYSVNLRNGATHNIFNRCYSDNVGNTFFIRHNAHNNTIQNSRFDNQNDPGYDGGVCIQLGDWGVAHVEVFDTKVINNEFYNQNDGFQTVRLRQDGEVFYEMDMQGTIVDSNMFTKDVVYMENAMDLKGGSLNPDNPMIISNNVMWGYFKHDDYGTAPGGPNPEYPAGMVAIQIHYDTNNLVLKDNIFYDNHTDINIGGGSSASGYPYGTIDSQITNNIMAYKNMTNDSDSRYRIMLNTHVNTNFDDNYVICGDTEPANKMVETFLEQPNGITSTNSFSRTKFVNSPSTDYNALFIIRDDPNNYWTYSWVTSYENSIATMTTEAQTAYTDYKYYWNKFGGSPELITVPKILDPNGTIVSPV